MWLFVMSHATLRHVTVCAVFQAFSTSWFLYANPTNHHLVFFLLEVFNNMIQYQFDGLPVTPLCLLYNSHNSINNHDNN